jgi:site-specific DNA recombinase
MGGTVPLGYQVENRQLIVDPEEATTVSRIFQRYLVLGSLPALQQELRVTGVVTRTRMLSGCRAHQ